MLKSNDPVPYTTAAVPPDTLDPTVEEDRILRQAADILFARMVRHSEPLTRPEQAGSLLCTRIGGNQVESLGVLFLDNQHRMITLEELFTGTPDSCNVSPAHIIRRCVHHRATSVILYHNHPSGITTPSEADYTITERIITALRAVDVTVLDHLVVSGARHESLRESRGQLFD